jgi:hypothetical protein
MRLAALILALAGSLHLALELSAQQPNQPDTQDPIQAASQAAVSDYIAKREAALSPLFHLIQQHDYVAARVAMQPLLTMYPVDLRVLFLAADIERIDRNFEAALSLYQRCLALKAIAPGVIHLGMVRTYADMNQWAEFNHERAMVRQMAVNGDRTLSTDRGYTIEDHRDGALHIEVLEFPSTDLKAVTRFRFQFLNDRLPTPKFTPSIDLESNPSDAASFAEQFPHEAAAHVRPFALASYPDAHTRAFIKFYPTGEPPYEDVHAAVLALAPTFLKPPSTAPDPASHRPAYKKP